MKVFVISLKSSVERHQQVRESLQGIPFAFFDAENVRENPQHSIYSLYDAAKTKRYKGYQLTPPELGCFASHIGLWQQCVAANEVFLVLEDNLAMFGELAPQLDNIERLTQQYGVVKLGNVFERKFAEIDVIDEKYRLVSHLKGACGTSAYAITPQAAQHYLEQVNGFFEPVDDFMDNEWRTGQTLYSYYPKLVSRSETKSVIGQRKNKTKLGLFNKVTVECYRLLKQFKQARYNKRYK
ncbi:glycosyltransferase family 25 protein [Shewanella halifaxensis]|uniref:glycosyltransferase family 25 protein n=1 Tax=Shewanella halifaxensis TaxID=271098 RepID=UPI000D59D099|nr:glycosyltransferase family 25 protein [Shewanella halifaxensis]